MAESGDNLGSFKNAICMRNGWLPSSYMDKVLWRCMHKRGVYVARLINALNPGYFRRDRELIMEIGDATNLMDFKEALSKFASDNKKRGGLLRGALKLRISGQRTMRLGAEYFG